MKKRVILLCIGIIISIGILTVSYNCSNNTFVKDGVTYALTIDGTSVDSFPSKGMYRVDASCNNATGKWLYDEWKLAIEDIGSDNVTCDVDFTTISQTNLNDYIINLSGSEQGTGKIVNENGYRYEGKNPNNYILFNNELWRIIGVFDEESHGQSGQNLVKIIRSYSLGGLPWNKSNVNDWTSSTVMNLLNGPYLNRQNGTDGEYCYISATVPKNCDYTVIGINDIYRPMIKEVTWYLGGHANAGVTVDSLYNFERGTTVYSGNATSWEGYIGLMYPSDYGYSVLSNNCARTTNLSSYNTASCAGQSWIFSAGYEWAITPNSSTNNQAFYLYDNGNVGYSINTNVGYSIRPVLYLSFNVYLIDGNGSITDPYIIGMQ